MGHLGPHTMGCQDLTMGCLDATLGCLGGVLGLWGWSWRLLGGKIAKTLILSSNPRGARGVPDLREDAPVRGFGCFRAV